MRAQETVVVTATFDKNIIFRYEARHWSLPLLLNCTRAALGCTVQYCIVTVSLAKIIHLYKSETGDDNINDDAVDVAAAVTVDGNDAEVGGLGAVHFTLPVGQ